MRKTGVMQRVDPTCQHREKHPIEREIYSACSRLFLRGYTHTQRLLGSLFVHSEHFAKLDRNENGFKKQKKISCHYKDFRREFSKNSKLTMDLMLICVHYKSKPEKNNTIFPPHYHDCGSKLYTL